MLRVFARVAGQFWTEIDAESSQVRGLLRIKTAQGQKGSVQVVPSSFIKRLTGVTGSESTYMLYMDGSLIGFQPFSVPFFTLTKNDPSWFEYKVRFVFERFQAARKGSLLERLFSGPCDLKHILAALCDYSYSDQFSLWLYNPYTQCFTLHCSSFDSETDHIHESNPRTSLSQLRHSDESYYCKILESNKLNSKPLEGMQTVNRFKIEVKSSLSFGAEFSDILGKHEQFFGILSFYSKHAEFCLPKDVQALVIEATRFKLSTEFIGYASWYSELVRTLAGRYTPGNLKGALKNFVRALTQKLRFEAASVFLINNKEPDTLKLVALSDESGQCPPVAYPLRTTALTCEVFKTKSIRYSYDIQNASGNSQIFNEKTRSKPRNWIGVPIVRGENKPFGVLRAKNKHEENGRIVPFNFADVEILRTMGSILGYLCDAEVVFEEKQAEAERRLIAREHEFRELSDFLKTFRHEIKSPLIVITEASTLMKLALKQEGLTSGEQLPKKVREICDDLDMVGHRLSFVANILTFDAHELVKDVQTAKVYTDVVTPVLAFARAYAKNRDKEIVEEKDSMLSLPPVQCDPVSASMAFHILIDNAIKYSPKGGIIRVYGRSIAGDSSIFVENRGAPIFEEERERVFDKYFRGRWPSDQKIEGSGIGLFLAKEIMDINNGSIELRQPSEPTIFELRINSADV